MNKLLGITLIFIILGITGCTHKNVEVYKVTDSGLTCNDLLIEIGEVKALNNDIDEKTGISGRNVGMGLIFWPGIIVNQMNASEARELANKRMERLVALSEKNNCNLNLKNNYSNKNGFDRDGYDKDGYDKDGFNVKGYNRFGCDKDGFSKYTKKFNCKEITSKYHNIIFEKGFDIEGYDKDGYDKNGFNIEGFDKDGYDKNGFNMEGFDKEGFNKLKQNKNEIINKRLKILINSKPNIHKVIESNLKKQEKNKYESDEEYWNRMKNTNFEKFGVMDIEIEKEYEPNQKIYKINFKTKTPNKYLISEVKYGKNTHNLSSESKLNNVGLIYSYDIHKTNETRINSFGTRVNVTIFNEKTIDIYPDNFNKILKMESVYPNSKETLLSEHFHHIAIPVSKEKARDLDKQKLVLRVNVEFVDIFNVYSYGLYSDATFLNPYEVNHSSYGLNVKIKEMIVFNKSTNEVLYSYADF